MEGPGNAGRTAGARGGSAGGGGRSRGERIRRLAAPALLALVAACGAVPGQISGSSGRIGDVMMPPDEYIRPFSGKVTVMTLPHGAGAPVLSLSHHFGNQCAIWLPKVGDPEISRALYQCLAVIEIANCNGATDINTPAVRARTPSSERARYARPCSGRNWSWAFDAVRATAVVDQTASAGSMAASPLF